MCMATATRTISIDRECLVCNIDGSESILQNILTLYLEILIAEWESRIYMKALAHFVYKFAVRRNKKKHIFVY